MIVEKELFPGSLFIFVFIPFSNTNLTVCPRRRKGERVGEAEYKSLAPHTQKNTPTQLGSPICKVDEGGVCPSVNCQKNSIRMQSYVVLLCCGRHTTV